jgi:PST family polysaccharide transporter
MVTAAMPIGFVLLALGEPLAVLVFGERWAEAGEATRALAFFIPAQAVAQVIGEGFKGSGRPPERTWVNVVGVVAGVLTMVALIPPLGLIGVAIGVSVDAIASAGFAILRAHRGMGIPLRLMFSAIVPQLVAALAMVAVLLPLETLVLDAASHGTRVGLALLALEGAIGLAIYVAALLVLRPGLVAEFRTLVSSARRSGRPGPEISDHPKPSDA